jgi:hypothetical protein
MEIEHQYIAALDLTHQMLVAATDQDWDALTGLERQRAALIALIPPITKIKHSLDPALGRRIAGIITQMELENADILEQAEVWQKHVRILLRMDKPAVV